MKLVVDASVAVKWVLRDRPGELDVDRASALLGEIARCSAIAVEPVHWVAEVIGVITRLKPDRAPATIALLTHARFTTVASRAVYRRAADMSIALKHHLFDTLYHAVALEEQATLVTADEVYFGKAKDLGAIQLLGDFPT
jgi:predicted nucleic acid-binding protein